VRHGKAGAPGYGAVAKSLHWLVVVLLVAQYTLGWTMPHVSKSSLPVGLIFWHVSVGMLLLAVVLFRLGWRLAHPVASLGGVPLWQHWIAEVTHILLYIALFIQIFLGWANASARAWKIDIFGAVPMLWIVPASSPVGMTIGTIHDNFAIVLLGLIALHAAAALYHHFVLHDRVLLRMLSGASH
jgi:cytochrome b561